MKNLGKVYILGDSYSTFEGWSPQGYETFYRSEPIASEVRKIMRKTKTDTIAASIKSIFSKRFLKFIGQISVENKVSLPVI